MKQTLWSDQPFIHNIHVQGVGSISRKAFFFLNQFPLSQRAEEILNKISDNINKTYTGLISVLQGFQKCIAWNPSN